MQFSTFKGVDYCKLSAGLNEVSGKFENQGIVLVSLEPPLIILLEELKTVKNSDNVEKQSLKMA